MTIYSGLIFPLKMVIFYSYVSLPEGKWAMSLSISSYRRAVSYENPQPMPHLQLIDSMGASGASAASQLDVWGVVEVDVSHDIS